MKDISVESLLAGRRPGESPASLRRWLAARKSGARLSAEPVGRLSDPLDTLDVGHCRK